MHIFADSIADEAFGFDVTCVQSDGRRELTNRHARTLECIGGALSIDSAGGSGNQSPGSFRWRLGNAMCAS